MKKQNKEFNLSEEILESELEGCDTILTRDVKEFIKRLKEEKRGFLYSLKQDNKIDEIIDNLAGDKLK